MIPPPRQYDYENEARYRNDVDGRLKKLLARGRDNETGSGHIIITDEDDGTRYRLKVASGVLTLEPV
jgi:hypothetical protein